MVTVNIEIVFDRKRRFTGTYELEEYRSIEDLAWMVVNDLADEWQRKTGASRDMTRRYAEELYPHLASQLYEALTELQSVIEPRGGIYEGEADYEERGRSMSTKVVVHIATPDEGRVTKELLGDILAPPVPYLTEEGLEEILRGEYRCLWRIVEPLVKDLTPLEKVLRWSGIEPPTYFYQIYLTRGE